MEKTKKPGRGCGSYRKNKKLVKEINFIDGQGSNYCEYCGKRNLQSIKDGLHNFLTIDHFIPLGKGGGHRLDNLRVVCKECNDRKADSLPKDFFAHTTFDELRRL